MPTGPAKRRQQKTIKEDLIFMASKVSKEFCSGCKKFYEMADGVWTPCPFCDGVGHALAGDDKEKILINSDNHYVPLRDRWDLKLR